MAKRSELEIYNTRAFEIYDRADWNETTVMMAKSPDRAG